MFAEKADGKTNPKKMSESAKKADSDLRLKTEYWKLKAAIRFPCN